MTWLCPFVKPSSTAHDFLRSYYTKTILKVSKNAFRKYPAKNSSIRPCRWQGRWVSAISVPDKREDWRKNYHFPGQRLAKNEHRDCRYSAECNDCAVDETIKHLLCYCSTYADERLHHHTVLKSYGRKRFHSLEDIGNMVLPITVTKGNESAAGFS